MTSISRVWTGLAGINPVPEHPGFEEFDLRPAFVEKLGFVDATYRSIRGPIGSSWKREEKSIQWTVTIPPNSTGRVYVPAAGLAEVRVNGLPCQEADGVSFQKKENDRMVLQVASGRYEIIFGVHQP